MKKKNDDFDLHNIGCINQIIVFILVPFVAYFTCFLFLFDGDLNKLKAFYAPPIKALCDYFTKLL
jgi:Tfp pilus assembly protein PilO